MGGSRGVSLSRSEGALDLEPLLEGSSPGQSGRRPLGVGGSSLRRNVLFLLALIVATLLGLVGGVFGNRYFGASLSALSLQSQFHAQFHGHWNHSQQEARYFALKNSAKKFKAAAFATRNLSFERIRSQKRARFDLAASDVLVFLHIQKTGGTTFEKFLTRHLDLPTPCDCETGRKRCDCPRSEGDPSQWLFSRFSTGWSCGLHADWTELVGSDCVDNVLDRKERRSAKRRFFYTTLLREPVARFVSEWRHVQRGATWLGSPHVCRGRPASAQDLPACFDPQEGWDGVSLDEFLDCPHNLALNRQTRMLADLALVGCYDQSLLPREKRDELLLHSAKANLRQLAYFGVLEELGASQAIFQRLFRLRFRHSLQDAPHKNKSLGQDDVTPQQLEEIRQRNRLDIELYDYARTLFAERAKEMDVPLSTKALGEIRPDEEDDD